MRLLLALALLADPFALLPSDVSPIIDRARVERGETDARVIPRTGTTRKDGVATAIVPMDARRLLAAARDCGSYEQFMPYVFYAEAKAAGDQVRCHQKLDLPWPFSNRHFDVLIDPVTTDFTPDGMQRHRFAWSYVQGSGNIRGTSGSWTFVSLPGEKTLVCYVVAADLGVPLPRWALDIATRYALPGVIEATVGRAKQQR